MRQGGLVNDERLTVTVDEAAGLLGISRAFAYELVARKELPSIKLGRRVIVPRQALERLLDVRPETPSYLAPSSKATPVTDRYPLSLTDSSMTSPSGNGHDLGHGEPHDGANSPSPAKSTALSSISGSTVPHGATSSSVPQNTTRSERPARRADLA